MKPLAFDLCSGLGDWAEGLEAEGYDVIRVDIEDMFAATGMPKPPGCLLMLQDILTFHGSQAKHAALIVASPPCQKYSYMAMPWSLAKAKAVAIRADESGAMLAELNALFNACFRIQREASEAAGRHIPMVVENVKGAQPWVGRARWNFGSYYLWGDIPALMPPTSRGGVKVGGMGWYPPDDPRHQVGAAFNPAAQGAAFADAREARKNAQVGGGSWFAIGSPGQSTTGGNPDGRKVPGFRFDGSGRSFQSASVAEHVKSGAEVGGWFGDGNSHGHGRRHAHKSKARKLASAAIAKIPEPLARHIGRAWFPRDAGRALLSAPLKRASVNLGANL